MSYETDYQEQRKAEEKAFYRENTKWVLTGIGAIFGTILLLSTWFTTEEGNIYYVQDTLFGTTTIYSQAGVHFKTPFFTKVFVYKMVATIDMTPDDEGNFTRNLGAVEVQFADTYSGTVPATFRYRLPTDVETFTKLHKDFRGFDNLVDSLLVNNSKNVGVVTATQYTGEEFFQGGVNAYKIQMEDQLRNGLYVTKREQVTIKDTGYAPVSSTNSNANQVEVVERLVTKNVIQLDENGVERRQDNPMAQYGILVTQVTIGKPTADTNLETLLDNKRKSIGEKISAEQQIDTNRSKAEAAKQEREISKQQAIQDAQREKELAVIAQQQEVEVERQRAQKELVQQQKQKDVAVIQKEKELEIATANRDIQKAAAEAAKYEAEAIKAKGLAEAEVDRAKLKAKQDAASIYMAEIQRDIAQVMYPALKDVQIDMPDFYAAGSSEQGAPTSLEVFTTLGAQKMLEERKPAPTE